VKINRFIKTRGFHATTYVCRMCGKRTRETGESESSAQLCKRCFVISSIQNVHGDNDHVGPFATCAECRANAASYGVTV
jgi:hypothetical protein